MLDLTTNHLRILYIYIYIYINKDKSLDTVQIHHKTSREAQKSKKRTTSKSQNKAPNGLKKPQTKASKKHTQGEPIQYQQPHTCKNTCKDKEHKEKTRKPGWKGGGNETPTQPPHNPRKTTTSNPIDASKGRVAPPTHEKCRNCQDT